jgi:hypothetical protein
LRLANRQERIRNRAARFVERPFAMVLASGSLGSQLQEGEMSISESTIRGALKKLAEFRLSTLERIIKEDVSRDHLDTLLKTQDAIDFLKDLQRNPNR